MLISTKNSIILFYFLFLEIFFIYIQKMINAKEVSIFGSVLPLEKGVLCFQP